MKKSGIAAALLGLLCLVGSSGAFAQVKGIYWTTSGKFGPFPITGLIPSVPKEKQRDVTIPVSMWIIDHPKGLVVFDTGNNVAMFPNAIHVMQKKELYQGWWPEKFQGRSTPGTFVMADLMAAREFNYLELNGDYDLFGDGSVLILTTPGHTLGHQSVKVKTAGSGTLILSQDAIWMQENLDGYPAGL